MEGDLESARKMFEAWNSGNVDRMTESFENGPVHRYRTFIDRGQALRAARAG